MQLPEATVFGRAEGSATREIDLVLARSHDGFSCRTYLRQRSERTAFCRSQPREQALLATVLRARGLGRAFSAGETANASKTKSLEERVLALETEVTSLKTKLAEVEKLAKRKGFMAVMMEYGAPFALWYAFCWSGSLFSIYLLLEWEVVSWQESLRPFFQGLGLDAYTERIDASTGNLVIAFMVNELLEAVRFPLVLATATPIIRLSNNFRKASTPATAATAATAAGAVGSTNS